jgi:hypothetical protein
MHCARTHVRLDEVLDSIRDNLRREQKTVMELNCAPPCCSQACRAQSLRGRCTGGLAITASDADRQVLPGAMHSGAVLLRVRLFLMRSLWNAQVSRSTACCRRSRLHCSWLRCACVSCQQARALATRRAGAPRHALCLRE